MNWKRLTISGIYLLLSILNLLLGTIVVAVMAGSDFIVPFFAIEEQHATGKFSGIFLYLMHPATGTLYSLLLAGLIIYQNKIKRVSFRLAVHLIFLLISSMILLTLALDAVNVYG